MSVPPAPYPLPSRFARWLLACAVRHWPKQTRDWGMALAAEIDQTANMQEALRWSWGGIMLFARSLVAGFWAWLKLPAGAPHPTHREPSDRPVLPRRSRLFTFSMLTAGAIVLLLPLGRQAMTMVRDSWNEFRLSASEQRELAQLAQRAEKTNDAPALAFVALRIDDPARYAALADRAVSLNPAFVWVYVATRSHWPLGGPQPEQYLSRLRVSDPGNAVPVLLAADTMAQRAEKRNEPKTPAEREALLARDANWMGLMEQALTAPRYDDYLQRHSELTSSVWSREQYLPASVVLEGLFAHTIPNLLNLTTFSNIQLRGAEKAVAAGEWHKAERLLGEVDSFGERIVSAKSTEIEKLIGLKLARDANQERVKLYAAAGRTAEAQGFRLRVQQIDDTAAALWARHDAESSGGQQGFRRWGILLYGSGALAVIAGCAGFVAILLLEFLPAGLGSRKRLWPRSLCWTADYAPAVFLLASAAFLMSSLPYAHAISESFWQSNGVFDGDLTSDALLLPRFLKLQAVVVWSSITVVLAAIAIFIVGHSIYRNKGIQRKQI